MAASRAWTGLAAGLVVIGCTLPLRASAPPGRYETASDTVHDKKTQLTWQRLVPSQPLNWSDAASSCQSLSLGGAATGWRLPTKKELETLVDRRAVDPAIDTAAFPNTPLSAFWTSSAYANDPATAWVVDFQDGRSYSIAIDATRSVRCVR